jgi:putative ABC transport system permease protein
MIDSFKNTVSIWLEETLQGDIYITPPLNTAAQLSGTISKEALDAIYQQKGSIRIDRMRSIQAELETGPIQLVATDNPDIGNERIFTQLSVPQEQMTDALRRGGIIITEPLAVRLNITEPGMNIRLLTADGWRDFPVEGIFLDYSSSEGSMVIWQDVYTTFWKDQAVSALALRLPEGMDPDSQIAVLRESLKDKQQLLIRANKTLRADVMEVFNRTFAITAALRLQAIVVAFIGILSALFLLQIEKQREIGILRAIGLTGKELWRLVAAETGLMGLAAGILALPTGYILSLILIYVINKRSFGWTIQMQVEPDVFIQAILVSVLAALLAGVYPAFRLSRMEAADAIRYE